MMEEDATYTLRSNPNNNIMIGLYTGSLLTCAVRIALIEYLMEKKKKMFSFLHRLGLRKYTYYSYHIFWNFVISLILMLPFVAAISYLLGSQSKMLQVSIAMSFGCLANALYIMCMALFFYSEITGLNVIGTVNFAISIATSMIPKNSPFGFLMYSNPQSQMVKMLERYALDPPESESFSLHYYLLLFSVKILVFGVLFVLIENLSKNEYGYYYTDSLCSKKKTKTSPAEVGLNQGRNTEMHFEMTHSISIAGDDLEDRSEIAERPEPPRYQAMGRIDQDESVMLKVQDVKKSFGANSVLEAVSFNLIKGEMLCLLGANGAGKSTLFNIILDNIEPDEGSIDQPFNKKNITYCPQHDMGWDYLTIAEHFELILAIQPDQEALRGRLEKVRDLTMLAGHWDVLGKNLSGGYKRRLTLAMALLSNSDIILMDEPTTALDMEIRYNIMKGISKAREELGTTILYTTHHLEDAENFSDTILIMSKGKIILKGSIEELRRQFNLITIRLYGIDSKSLRLVEQYVEKEIMQEVEVKQDSNSSVSLRLGYDASMNLVNHIRYFEKELGLIVDLKQTSLEDVYVMEGEFENYNTIDSVGRVNLDDCWRKLISTERRPTFLKCFKLMMKKSSLS